MPNILWFLLLASINFPRSKWRGFGAKMSPVQMERFIYTLTFDVDIALSTSRPIFDQRRLPTGYYDYSKSISRICHLMQTLWTILSWQYMHWTDTERKRFFDFILERSAHSQLKFILGWFKKPILPHQDFVIVLPRVVSTHILSYLDPRSLCRAACVSWPWKWLADQDIIWKRKCLRFGWYLPYQPSDLENGAWKKHYMMCIQTMNIEIPKKSVSYSWNDCEQLTVSRFPC